MFKKMELIKVNTTARVSVKVTATTPYVQRTGDIIIG